MFKRSAILTEREVANLQATRDHLMSEKLDRSRRALPTAELDAALAHIETMLINHRAGLARLTGVHTHG